MANTVLGNIESITGKVTVFHKDGSSEDLTLDAQVYAEDVISTGKNAHVRIQLLDGSVLKLDAGQTAVLDAGMAGTTGSDTLATDDGAELVTVSNIGVITSVQGDVQVIRDGQALTLRAGDSLVAGDELTTGPDSAASLRMLDGSSINIGPDFHANLNDELFSPKYEAFLEQDLEDPSAIQAAILAGQDPSTDLTTPGAGESGNEGGEAVYIEPSGRAVTPESGHDTHGQELPFRIPDEELLQNPVVDRPVDARPDALDDGFIISEDSVLPGDVSVNDDAGDAPATFEVVSGPDHGSLEFNPDGTFVYTPDTDYNGPDSFTYVITDADGESDTATASIQVNPVNDAPVAVDDALEAVEDTVLTISAADLFGADGTGPANDYDIDSASFSSITVQSLVSHGVLELDGVAVALGQEITAADIGAGLLTFVPEADYVGDATFDYTVSDGVLSSDAATVTIAVGAVNDAPVAYPDTNQITELETSNDLTDNNVTGNVLTGIGSPDSAPDFDIDGDVLTVTTTGVFIGAYGTLTLAADGSYTYELNDGDPAVDGLNDGEMLQDVFNYSITDGNSAASSAVTITINGVTDPSFPTGLAYTVAGSKVVTGEQLYSIDLMTGETTRIAEVLINGESLAPNAVDGMSVNPVDGSLYAVAKSGGDSYLIKINPATGETELIDGVNSFAKASAATFGADGSLYLAFGHQLYVYDLENPGTGSSLTLLAQGSPSRAVDGIAINSAGDTMYLAEGNELWAVSVDPGGPYEVPALIGQITESINGSTHTYTLDGMSFDDNEVLWGLDDAGNILRIDPISAAAEQVATLAVNEVTGAGTDSLAISTVHPGTYIVLSDASAIDMNGATVQDRADSYTHYVAGDEYLTTTVLDPTDIDIATVADANVTVTTGPNNELGVDNTAPTDVDNVFIKSDSAKDISVTDFDSVDVTVRGDGESVISVTNAERGVIDTGDADDSVQIITNPLVGDGGSDETFLIHTDGGDDTISLGTGALSAADFVIDTGESKDGSESSTDLDILVIDDDIFLGAGNIDLSNIEAIEVSGSGNNTVTLNAQDVLDMTDSNNILRIDGDSTDGVEALPGDTWSQVTDQMIGAVNYHTFVSNGATLLVNEDMQLLGEISMP